MRSLAALLVSFSIWAVACGGEESAAPSCPTPSPTSSTDVPAIPPAKADPSPTPSPASKIPNDLNDEAVAKICDEINYHWAGEFSGELFRGVSSLYVEKNIAETKTAEGKFVTSLTFVLEESTVTWPDPAHGKSRTDAYSTLTVAMVSDVSRPDAFAEGKTETVHYGSGLTHKSWCAEDGSSMEQGSGVGSEGTTASLTITNRTAERIGGTFYLTEPVGSTPRSVTFEVLLRTSPRNVCCLK